MGPLGSIAKKDDDLTFGGNGIGVLFTVQKAQPLFFDGGSTAFVKAALRSFERCQTVDLKER